MNTELIKELEDKIILASKAYYSGNQIMSDSEFDNLVDQLKSIDPNNELISKTGFGYSPVNSKTKLVHLSRLHGISDKRKVDKDYIIRGKDFIVTPKLDGGSLELQYIDGKLISAVTRGDGVEGIDVTANVLNAQGIIKELKDKSFIGNIVGEFLISKEDIEASGNYTDINRNIPNGFLGRNTSTPDEQKYFTFIAYKVGASNLEFDSRVSILKYIESNGFITVPYKVNDTPVAYCDYLDNYFEIINGKHYMYDGVVVDNPDIKVSVKDELFNIEYLNEVAYKVITSSATTEILDIEWNLTRTGRLVPVAKIKEVYLSGAYINRVTLNNYSNVVTNKIGIGSVVEVVRSGEVIPLITKILIHSTNYNYPHECPNCDGKLTIKGKDLICDNNECNEYASLYRFIYTMSSIKGVGSSMITKLVDTLNENKCYTIDDFVGMDYQVLIKLVEDTFSGNETIKKMILCINQIFRMTHSMSEFLVAMNIKGLSWGTSQKLSLDSNLYDVLNCDETSILISNKIKGSVPSKVTDYLLTNLRGIRNRFSKLHITDDRESCILDSSEDKLNICITGSLNGFTKSKFYETYADKITESSVKECDYLVCNTQSKQSSKLKTANSLNKRVVTQDELIKIITKGV